ncbi:hypothetical protein BHM03_00031619 [Ensete ventricosum]|nr:hypothetical protein BHM03_00031619 [Ensete ventricosum]
MVGRSLTCSMRFQLQCWKLHGSSKNALNDASSPHGKKRCRLVLPLEDEATPRPHARRQGVTLFPHGEMSISMVSPGSGRSAYRYPVGPICIARTEWYRSK